MLTFLKKFLSLKPRVIPEPAAPYKVEAPASAEAVRAPVKCGCGRSSTGDCVGLHALTADQWAASDKNPNRVVAEEKPAEVTTVKKAPAKPKVTKPKTPAKPRRPKSST